MASKTFPDLSLDESEIDHRARASWLRWPFSLALLVVIGWLWPYDPLGVPERLADTSWTLGWLTVLVLIGATIGYTLHSLWVILLAPFGLYAGGVIHWLQYDWGWRWPEWNDFLSVSGIALAVLLVTTGLAAGVACRVVSIESRANASRAEGIRVSAAVAALLGLLAITAIYVLPFPYIGGLLGVAALLSGVTIIQEGKASAREHLLVVGGMIVGIAAAATQLYELWSFMRNL